MKWKDKVGYQFMVDKIFGEGEYIASEAGCKGVMETKLTAREEKILKLHYGLDGEHLTFAGIGDVYGVTRERIRQIEAKALRKMRHPTRAKLIVRGTYIVPSYFQGQQSDCSLVRR